MKIPVMFIAAMLFGGCAMSGWPGGYGYGYPAYGYRYPAYGYGYPGYGWGGYGYGYGYNAARRDDWRRWQAYQYGFRQGQASQAPSAPSLPYGITQNPGGTYRVPGYGDFTGGQIRNWARKHRR